MSVKKPFAEHGHYTAVHDAVFDVVMPYCPANAFKVLLFVLRKTRGWKKEEDVLRYAEIKAGTGIKSDTTLSKALEFLLVKKLLNARDEDGTPHERGTRQAPAYSLNREFELKAPTPENGADPTPENGASNNQLSQEPITSPNGDVWDPAHTSGQKLANHFYERLRERYKVRLTRDEHSAKIGQFKDVLKKDSPTADELQRMVKWMLDTWPQKQKTPKDAIDAIRLGRDTGEAWAGPAPWEEAQAGREPTHPHSEKAHRARDKPRGYLWYQSAFGITGDEAMHLVERFDSHEQIMEAIEKGDF